MGISDKTIKILWANSAGLCSFAQCKERLTIVSDISGSHSSIGEMAHIKGEKAGSNRHDASLGPLEVNDYNNLILLCPNHHTLIDKKEQEHIYTTEVLTQIKKDHISYIENKVLITQEPLKDLKKKISILIAENKLAWESYGPKSALAIKNPHNEEAYQLWTSARISTIVPNNRTITKIIKLNRNAFPPRDNEVLAKFLLHSESYERWVNSEIEYNSVIRYPDEFEKIINGRNLWEFIAKIFRG